VDAVTTSINMTLDETKALLRVLVELTKADMVVEPQETTRLQELAGHALPPVPTQADWASGTKNIDDTLRSLKSPASRAFALSALAAVAMADGVCTEQEQTFLDRVRAALDPEQRFDMQRARSFWAERGDKLEEALAAANDRFLHRMATVSGGAELPLGDYMRLIEELNVEKRALVVAALDEGAAAGRTA
jgi:hypothetical protein